MTQTLILEIDGYVLRGVRRAGGARFGGGSGC